MESTHLVTMLSDGPITKWDVSLDPGTSTLEAQESANRSYSTA